MPQTMIEKILSSHAGRELNPGDIAEIELDYRAARDFGGANVVKNLEEHNLTVRDTEKTLFTFDCNPTGSDQRYAANQQTCRLFARRRGIRVHDIDSGIGTHLAIDDGYAWPGSTFVSTDSHANILGAIGAFGQGLGDVDMAAAWAHGKVWFKVPPTLRVELKGWPDPYAKPKDVVLAMLEHFGANGLLGCAAEVSGQYVDALDVSGRVTIASMATEMGAVVLLFPPNEAVVSHCRKATGRLDWRPVHGDPDAKYEDFVVIDIQDLGPMVAEPGHPEAVVPIEKVAGRKIDSAFIGSCTNGRFNDLEAAADVLKGRKVAPGVVLKIVPATDRVWKRAMTAGLFETFKEAGAMVSNAGCAGCAAGQVGQNGPGEVTVSTGNRNFAGKQGKGEVYLASPSVAAASAVAGVIVHPSHVPEEPVLFEESEDALQEKATSETSVAVGKDRPLVVTGSVWVIEKDNIDTDMIFHNRHLAITRIEEMGEHAFGNLQGWEDFPQKAAPGDIIVTGRNFGAGSSRQQAVDCFKALGAGAIVAKSFGSIYERNAINAGFPIVVSDLIESGIKDGEEITVDFTNGKITRADGKVIEAQPWPQVQIDIYKRGGLLG